ncbi:nitrous oxide reductase family maturation protein NosD [Pseudomonas schmalbachii]|uniref:Nitrous oxide reductase family maturation protein NosD n=1 Tax=Pseudomonas schmalbachii TaxID=2816993 RepID=A0ABS3TL69_9PSED|nr:nitrous oxide reductase family maturation protein NosD [Pseudomonas schmalbachii]MBO3274404.1 nitrous oxide reductase family maturation protein NosD [Pseudomonas schmalbachii]
MRLTACLAGLLLAVPALAGVRLTPEQGDLQAWVERSSPGTTLVLAPGIYRGPLVIDRPLTLQGEEGAVIDGGGHGSVLSVRAADVTVEGLELRRSGSDLGALDAGIFVAEQSARVRLLNNRLSDVAFGIWLDKGREVQVRGNRIEGNQRLRSQDRGNGIHLFASDECLIENNSIRHVRDGIYIDTSSRNRLVGNRLSELRYGIHYMNSNDNEVRGNRTRHTRTGYALMQSRNLEVHDNWSEDDENYGLLLNFITHSSIVGNRILRARNAEGGAAIDGSEGKGLFIYNSLYNDIRDNLVEGSDLGIHLTAGSEENRLYGNRFIANRTQVKYVSNREQEWSYGGRGNYWSDYLGWDMDGDGLGDRPYQPNDGVDKLLWRYPEARVLMNSPAIETLRWVQRQFPVLRPPGVRDSHPLMGRVWP